MRSATIRSPVTPLSDEEYASAKRLMETLDGNGAAFPGVLVNAGADNFTLKDAHVTALRSVIEKY